MRLAAFVVGFELPRDQPGSAIGVLLIPFVHVDPPDGNRWPTGPGARRRPSDLAPHALAVKVQQLFRTSLLD